MALFSEVMRFTAWELKVVNSDRSSVGKESNYGQWNLTLSRNALTFQTNDTGFLLCVVDFSRSRVLTLEWGMGSLGMKYVM